MEMLPRDTLVDRLEERLSRDILTGRPPVGALLPPERALAESLGITRTTLKHALARLARVGLLETRQGAGTRVRDYLASGGVDLLPLLVRHCPGWLQEVFEARHAIGLLIAGQAAQRATSPQKLELRALLDAVRAAEGTDAVQLADAEVHRALARASGNRVYVLLTNTLFSAYLPVRSQLTAPFQHAQDLHDLLAPVVEAVTTGNPHAAREAADAYLLSTQQAMTQQVGLL